MTVSSRPTSPRRLAWAVAALFLFAGIAGLMFAPAVAAHARTVVQVAHAWLCTSLVAAAFVIVRLSNDAEGASGDR
jgi:hypothetical protein